MKRLSGCSVQEAWKSEKVLTVGTMALAASDGFLLGSLPSLVSNLNAFNAMGTVAVFGVAAAGLFAYHLEKGVSSASRPENKLHGPEPLQP